MERIEVTGIVVPASLPSLKNPCVGGQHANIARDVSDRVDVVWPWTGRVNEPLYEEYPEWHENDYLWETPYSFNRGDGILSKNGDDELGSFEEL